jgi:cyclophilin family peptidyl-prolyl cis-trans isomerase
MTTLCHLNLPQRYNPSNFTFGANKMSKRKKNKAGGQNQPAKAKDGQGGGGAAPSGNEPLKVNWYVIGGAVLVVGALIFFSIQQMNAANPPSTQAVDTFGTQPSGEPMTGCTPQSSPCPPMVIDTGKQYTATVKLQKGGEFTIQLFPDKAPLTVNSFVYLARQGYFNGITFHRVLEDFMAQGGDPTGTGSGGPGYEFVNEDSDLVFDKAGVVAMANAGRDTNGSQFFITFGPTEALNGGYTIFGQVTDGMDVVNGITRRDPDTFPDFTGDAIESITITES